MAIRGFHSSCVRFLAIAALVAAVPMPAEAFGTVNALGQNAEHEKITRLALGPEGFQPKTLSELAGKDGTFGAVGAPDNPTRRLMSKKDAHCDGGDHLATPGYPQKAADAEKVLNACRAWIFSNIEKAVAEAAALLDKKGKIRDSQIPTIVACTYNGTGGRAKCNVMEALGLAFHAAQDFYSHSNWTDRNPAKIALQSPPGLEQDAPSPWLDPAKRGAFPPGLISGCYDGFPESLYCRDRVKHESLNKDKGLIDVAKKTYGTGGTPRALGNDNFARAASTAALDTRAKWRHFRNRVLEVYGQARGKTIICAMLKDNPVRTCE